MGTLYIIIGGPRTGKSATIRALTGFSRGYDPWLIATETDELREVFVISASPQEAPGTFAQHLRAINEGEQDTDVLMALHPDNQALDFTQQVQQRHEREIRWVLLRRGMSEIPDEFRDSLPEPDAVIITNFPHQPANLIAHQIRGLWGWL
jgi:hypothetical protein